MTSRRDFLRSAASVPAAALVAWPVATRAFTPAPIHLTVGETFVCQDWLNALAGTLRGAAEADGALRAAMRTMRSTGSCLPNRVDAGARHLVTVPAPGVEPFELVTARRIARQINDALAETVNQSNRRIRGMATLVAIDPSAVDEARRAVHRLGFEALSLGTNRGIGLHHPRLRPVFEFAETARVPVYLPATHAPLAGDAPYRAMGRAGVLLGAAADAAAHLNELIFGGVLDMFPSLTVIVSRLGEGLPYWYGRTVDTYYARAHAGAALPRRHVDEYFARNILLTTGEMSTATLAFCDAVFGDHRLIRSHDPGDVEVFSA